MGYWRQRAIFIHKSFARGCLSAAAESRESGFGKRFGLSKMPGISDICTQMKILRFLKGRCQAWRQHAAQRALLRRFLREAAEITPAQWGGSLQNPLEFYEHCFHYFYTRLPKSLREHRAYFELNGRGFGERAFHVMWFLIFREFRPESFLEIGVYRGQTLSLAALLARHFKFDCFVQGISPFCPLATPFQNTVATWTITRTR